ncbi:MAG: hypothetical protein KF752_17270 [Pirellulaceae bacterium]|nr:hypothetical protein [Pirellulaceae bacterium]
MNNPQTSEHSTFASYPIFGGTTMSRAAPTSGSGTLWTDGGLRPTSIARVRRLGSGRAAQAYLVEIQTADGRRARCVEKVFRPNWLTRFVYRVCFQAPFAYQENVDAILACFYRRRVAWAICRAFLSQVQVAYPLYVRWDSETQAMVLASELAEGRGIIPAAVKTQTIRQWLGQRSRTGHPTVEDQTDDMPQLLSTMNRFEELLIDCGLVGSGWQVCTRSLVSTANLLRTERGYAAVDLESGIPAMLVPKYLVAGLRLGRLPMFDDLDAHRLKQWFIQNYKQLDQRLETDQLDQLANDIDQLVQCSANWKASEPTVAHKPWRLLTRRFRDAYSHRVIESWSRQHIIDSTTRAGLIQSSQALFQSPVYWLGCIPGHLGRFLQRCVAHRAYCRQVRRFFSDVSYRTCVLGRYAEHKAQGWQESGRLSAGQPPISTTTRFAAHWVLSRTTPTMLHRWLTDSRFRRDRWTRAILLLCNRRFQAGFGRLIIGRRIQTWREAQRISEPEASRLVHQLHHPAVEEYVRGFGLHVGLKLLIPLVLPLKAAGAAASVASGNPIYFLVMLMLLPILRTALTLWRVAASGRPVSDFRDALLVGLLPTVGSLAFPVQMHASCFELSTFLLRDFAAKVGRALPIYGGKDSRTEIACIQSINLLAELMDIWLSITRSPRQTLSTCENAEERVPPPFEPTIRLSRWDRPALEQLALMNSEFVETHRAAERYALTSDRVWNALLEDAGCLTISPKPKQAVAA